jgi:thiamine kinase-like enzyme
MIDNFDSVVDLKMPFLSAAIDPAQVKEYLTKYLSIAQNTQIAKIEFIRHKPGRRCLIEYELVNDDGERIILIGKIRAKGTDFHSYELQKYLWKSGFIDDSVDGISVPEPMGVIPEWQMWLQRKVEGVTFTQLLTSNNSVLLGKRIAEAAHKLHTTNIPPRRSHTMNDELRILHERIPLVIQKYPQWQERLERILAECDYFGNHTLELKYCGIHRDFYPDQVIVNNERLYLIDLDLYCQGNPALDIGNFIAHIQEYSLRVFGNSEYLQEVENSLMEGFIQITDDDLRVGIEAYNILTLVRHIYISTLFLDRSFLTESLLNLCEQRFSVIRNL